MEAGEGLLVKGLEWDRRDLFVAVGFEQGGGVGAVGFVAQDVAAGVMRRQQQDAMAEALEQAPPVVSGATGLQQDRGGWLAAEEWYQLVAGEAFTQADPSRVPRDRDLEHVLGHIDGNGHMLFHGLLLS